MERNAADYLDFGRIIYLLNGKFMVKVQGSRRNKNGLGRPSEMVFGKAGLWAQKHIKLVSSFGSTSPF